jgi:Uma2 family endonuclease
MATQTLMTAEEFDRLPYEREGPRFELLNGELIEMSTATYLHNRIIAKLVSRLDVYLEKHGTGFVVPNTGFALNPETRVAPDLALLWPDRRAQIDLTRVPLPIAPNIAIEVVSPSESARNLDRRVEVFLQAGTEEVWVIYPESKHILVYTPELIRRVSVTQILETPTLPGWSLRVSELFEAL